MAKWMEGRSVDRWLAARKLIKYRKYTGYRPRERKRGRLWWWWWVKRYEGGINVMVSCKLVAAALLASARLGRQFLSDRVFLWELDYPRFPTPRVSISHTLPLSFFLSSRIPFLCVSSTGSRPASPRSLLSCRFSRDVSGQRRPIAARVELWNETEQENDRVRRRRVGYGCGWQGGREKLMQAGLRYPGLWTTSNPSTTTTTTTMTMTL